MCVCAFCSDNWAVLVEKRERGKQATDQLRDRKPAGSGKNLFCSSWTFVYLGLGIGNR